MSGFIYEKDSENIVTITMDMTGPVNAMNAEFIQLMDETINRLEGEKDEIAGVIITSAKETFFAGGDLTKIISFQTGDEDKVFNFTEKNKSYLRRLEQIGKPVVAAINGAALGGGCEICLACHYRIAINTPKIRIGMPEVSLGLLPGAGGIVRTVRMLGLQKAIPLLVEGKKLRPEKALNEGLINALASDREEMFQKAVAWIKANSKSRQPWDKKGYEFPGGGVDNPTITQMLQVAPGVLYKKTQGVMPAPEFILAVAAESLNVDVDTALRIESRYFTDLVLTPVAKNMINTFFFQLNALNAGGSRPKDLPKSKVQKVGVLGAGMMGQGIAYVSAMAGIEVILKDISLEGAKKGKSYSERLLIKAIERGRMDEEKKAAILELITPTDQNDALGGCDLIIECVFENMDLKHQVIKETEPFVIKEDMGVFASNTSTLPITELAKASEVPDNFIGLHFFSPVDKMPLVEIIKGEKTSDETLAKGFDYVQQIKKIPIVVNDSRGFFTSRVFSSFMDEGCRMVKEGFDPVLIDAMGRQAGMPVGPLTIHDEITQELSVKVAESNQRLDEQLGDNYCAIQEGVNDMSRLLVKEHNRRGRAYGGGWYDYPEKGKKEIWPKVYDLFYNADAEMQKQDFIDRILFRQIIESLRCYQEGVFNAVRDGNIGSIMGIGFPPYTGGVLQYINTYGIRKFTMRAKELAEQYGDRFEPPKVLLKKADKSEMFE